MPDDEAMEDETQDSSERTPEEELRRIAADAEWRRSDPWFMAGGRGRWGKAMVCRVRPTRNLHVVGASEMATELRRLLAEGAVRGWSLHPTPKGNTPLYTLIDALSAYGSTRFFNLLDRAGFTTVQEVQATPDQCLLGIRNIGKQMITALHEVIDKPASGLPAVTRSAHADDIPRRQQHLCEKLSPHAYARYRELVDGLARTRIPRSALDKIIEALNAEPVPPADPTVTLLLDTAGEQDLLDYYTRTHHPTSDSDEQP